jgi:phosphoserine phosphatase RsbU/P
MYNMDNNLDIAPCFYFTVGEDGILQSVNTTACTELGYSRSELVQQSIDVILPVASKIFYQTHLYPLVKMKGHAQEIFMMLRAKDGRQLPVLWNITVDNAGQQPTFVYIGLLVENRKKFEDELIQARKLAETVLQDNSALKAARENIEINLKEMDRQLSIIRHQYHDLQQLNHAMTHDLQEPLRKIIMFTGILTSNRTDLFDKATITQKLVASTVQMKTVIAGLQRYAWLSNAPVVRKELSLKNIIAGVQEKLAAEYPLLTIRVEVGALPSIMADEAQLRELFYQLLDNAIRFRQKEDEVVIHVNGFELDRNGFRNLHEKYDFNRHVSILVRDEGIGISPEYRELVFDLFRKFHTQSGRGLGLSLCKKIVDNHYGTITADSQPGVGTTITVILPVGNEETFTAVHAVVQQAEA